MAYCPNIRTCVSAFAAGNYALRFRRGRIAFMNAFQAWQLLLVALAGGMNRHQQDVIAYIQEENQILKSKLKGKRIRFWSCAGTSQLRHNRERLCGKKERRTRR